MITQFKRRDYIHYLANPNQDIFEKMRTLRYMSEVRAFTPEQCFMLRRFIHLCHGNNP